MKWLHPIGDVRRWLRWRESILAAEEDAAIRAALDQARTPEECALVDKIVAERDPSRRGPASQQ